jgi:hypothetical protein
MRAISIATHVTLPERWARYVMSPGFVLPPLIYMQVMRTLVDLLNDERGYVRVFAESDGYGYQVAHYLPRVTADLFEQMSGFPSLEAAREAARYQLSAAQPGKRRRRRTTR